MLSSGHQTVEGQKSTMFLLFSFFYPPYHSSFRLCVLKAVVFRGDQRTWHNAHFVAPSKIWYTAVSQWRQSQGIFHVCLSSDSKHTFVISLENFKSGHDFSSILWDQQEVFFYLWMSKLNFLFINEMQSVFIEEQLTSDCFPVAKIPFVSEMESLILKYPVDSHWQVRSLKPSIYLLAFKFPLGYTDSVIWYLPQLAIHNCLYFQYPQRD